MEQLSLFDLAASAFAERVPECWDNVDAFRRPNTWQRIVGEKAVWLQKMATGWRVLQVELSEESKSYHFVMQYTRGPGDNRIAIPYGDGSHRAAEVVIERSSFRTALRVAEDSYLELLGAAI